MATNTIPNLHSVARIAAACGTTQRTVQDTMRREGLEVFTAIDDRPFVTDADAARIMAALEHRNPRAGERR